MATALSDFKDLLATATGLSWTVTKKNFDQRNILCPNIPEESILNFVRDCDASGEISSVAKLVFVHLNRLMVQVVIRTEDLYQGLPTAPRFYTRIIIYDQDKGSITLSDSESEIQPKEPVTVIVVDGNFQAALESARSQISSGYDL